METHRDAVEGLLLLLTRSSCVTMEHMQTVALISMQCSETQTTAINKNVLERRHKTYPVTFRYSEIATNDEAVKFYTGLPTCSVFGKVLHLLACSPSLAFKTHARRIICAVM